MAQKRSQINPAEQGSVAPALDDKSLDIYVGMQVDLNGRDLTLIPKTPINKVKEEGLELALPDTIFLGKVGDTVQGLVESFTPAGSTPIKIDDLTTGIPAVDGIVNKVKAAELSLSKFHLKMPSQYKRDEKNKLVLENNKPQLVTQEEKDKNPAMYATEYTVGLAATWSDAKPADAESMGGFNMTMKGLFIMLTNEEQDPDELDQIIVNAAKEAQKVLAPSRELNAKNLELNAKKLQAQQKLAQATKAQDDLKGLSPGDDAVQIANHQQLSSDAVNLIAEAKKELEQLKGEVSQIEKLMSDTKKLVTTLAVPK